MPGRAPLSPGERIHADRFAQALKELLLGKTMGQAADLLEQINAVMTAQRAERAAGAAENVMVH